MNISEMKLKPCPFCGDKAVLKKTANGYRTAPTTILDEWTISCTNKCCSVGVFEDLIYHDDNGEIIVARDGAKDAFEAWNQRI